MRSMQCNVEFGFQLSIRSGTKIRFEQWVRRSADAVQRVNTFGASSESYRGIDSE
jgi:hypothetical protein